MPAESSSPFPLLDKVFTATKSIAIAKERAELKKAVAEGFLSRGFGSFNLGCQKSDKYELALDPTLHAWPAEFFKEYEARGWGDSDPHLERATTADRPFCWSIHDKHPDKMKQSYIDYLVSTPLRGGVVMPLPRLPGRLSSVSVESCVDTAFSEATILGIAMIAHAAVSKAEMLGMCSEVSADASIARSMLNEKQTEILKWAAAGKSNLDIGTIMGLTRRNVEYHMSVIFRKLHVATRAQAVAAFVDRED